MKWRAVLPVFLMAVALLIITPPADSAIKPAYDPFIEYPDADIIIYQSEKDDIVVHSAEGKERVHPGSDYTVIEWSDVEGSIDIVMLSGRLSDLTLVEMDVILDSERPIDISFDMRGGSIDTLQALSIDPRITQSLDSSYFTAYCPVDRLRMDISGEVTEVCPTVDLVEIRTLDISVNEGASIDRLYPTGEDGSYVTVNVILAGGKVGYMSNQSSVVVYLTYDLRKGSIDYLCLGADTEGGSGYYRGNMWTFYVQRDVDIRITEFVEIGTAVLGAGLEGEPSILCNGEAPETTHARNVLIDADSQEILADRCFITKDGRALRFSNYTIDGTPSVGSIRTYYYVSYQTLDIYGPEGIWDASRGFTLRVGCVLHLDTSMVVAKGSSIVVRVGGELVNAGHLAILGSLLNEGVVKNGGIIEKREGGTIQGDVSGDGFIVYCIYARPNEGRVELMAVDDNAVMIRSTTGSLEFDFASVRFNDSENPIHSSKVTVESLNGMFSGDSFLVVLEQDPEDDEQWLLYTSGFGEYSGLNVQVTVPDGIPEGYEGKVTGPDGESTIVSSTDLDLTFMATSNGIYDVHVEFVGDERRDWGFAVNAIIAGIIVIVASFVLYQLFRRD